MAEVMKFNDFKEEGSEAACKVIYFSSQSAHVPKRLQYSLTVSKPILLSQSAGKYRQQGRNYTVEDGDIIFFKFNAGAGLKDAKKK